ncbi:MAG: hypothetical protein Q9227_006065 [Pyrenula ochraceoflavens]
MQFTTLIAALTALSLSSAKPLNRRQSATTASLELCTDPNATGDCETLTPAYEICQTLDTTLNDLVSYAKTDSVSYCRMFVNPACTDTDPTLFLDIAPNTIYSDLTIPVNGVDYDNKFSAIHCSYDPQTASVAEAKTKVPSFYKNANAVDSF